MIFIRGRPISGLLGSIASLVSTPRLGITMRRLRRGRIGHSFRGAALGWGVAATAQNFLWREGNRFGQVGSGLRVAIKIVLEGRRSNCGMFFMHGAKMAVE